MIKPRKIILYIVIATIAIFTVPIGLNYLLPLNNSLFNINGNEEKWFSFWSSYSGAVISGLITLFVLFSTLIQNQKNHIKQTDHADELNRQQMSFQIKLFGNQIKQKWLIDLKAVLSDNLNILDFWNIERMSNKISIVSSNRELIAEIAQLESQLKSTQTNLSILYHDNFVDMQQKTYKDSVDNFVNNLNVVLIAFTKHLLAIEKVVVDIPFRIDNLEKGELSTKNRALLIAKTDEGYKGNEKNRDNILSTIANKKAEIKMLSDVLKLVTIELIKHEEKKIANELLR
ncbi:hypothetical protein QUH73_02425 [Labilibaculum sp. K2S]|uniref:hypothetical protein n=1 Tax=Labilibaculum sp. K2S TaxID=3056386 RepID=UPI0025A4ADED|nr:hypothetical protein [Labilibaculum sp. K2S]MDM8158665.1 hypothetical protein [Labilibaculum sp. K2S]